MTHTPGPLDIFGNGTITLENGETHEVQVLTAKGKAGNDEEVAYCYDIALATLIAAAPEIKMELQTADDLLAELSQYVSKDHEALIVKQRRRINNLLDKAEGKG